MYSIMFTEGTPFPLMDCVSIPTIDDGLLEGDHDFTVQIESVTPNTVAMISAMESTQVVTIIDNDGMLLTSFSSHQLRFFTFPPTMNTGMATVELQPVTASPISENGGPTIQMCCVEISGIPPDGVGCDITVNLNVASGTAGM